MTNLKEQEIKSCFDKQSQQLKLEKLLRELDLGLASADRGELFDADEVFKELLLD
ncbi:MAG: hypothetical protein HQL69_01600 [Magnetococcales bacterium]|nr:hypothetical protein [Magnetococcales bacterium]